MLHGIRVAFCLATIVEALTFGSGSVPAQEYIARLPGQPCRIDPLAGWSPQEKWVWKRVCEGMPANLVEQFGGSDDPSEANNWPGERSLSASFLETILLYEPFRRGITRMGVRITGARIKERVDLHGAGMERELWLDKSFLAKGVDLENAHSTDRITFDGTRSDGDFNMYELRVDKDLSMSSGWFGAVHLLNAKIGNLMLEGSKVSGRLYMDGLQIDGNLFMRNGARFEEVVLRGAKIGRQFGLYDSEVSGQLNMDSLEVGENLLMNKRATFAEVILRGARVRGDIVMASSAFTGLLNMDHLQVGGSLMMNDGSTFNAVILAGVKVGGQLAMSGSNFNEEVTINGADIDRGLFMNESAKFKAIRIVSGKIGQQFSMRGSSFGGDVHIEGAQVNGNVIMRDAEFSSNLELILTKIDGSLSLSGAKLESLDLSGTSIGGELSLYQSSVPVHWGNSPTLVLRNTVVGTVVDARESWPSDLQLVLGGFAYQSWGGLTGLPPGIPNQSSFHPTEWFAKSLARDRTYSPQPYEQLAKVLRSMGYAGDAEDVLYEGNKRALFEEGTPWYSKVTQVLLMTFIGFGHRLQYAVGWSLFFIVLGALIVRRTVEGRQEGIRFGFAYSVDTLLPLVKLREAHYKIDFPGSWRPARYYFYFHKLMGYVLASFLIAGLSGLTK